jgi:hypothetical protein
MNIFYLDECPLKAARYMCNKHVVKMCLETAQLISSYLRYNNYNDDRLYRTTHINHPSAKCLRDNINNFKWLCCHFAALLDEYRYRYNKVHASVKIYDIMLKYVDKYNYDLSYCKYYGLTTIAKVTDNDIEDVVQSYREYYRKKSGTMVMEWKGRDQPTWFQ